MFRILFNILITLLPQASFAGNVLPHDSFSCGASQVEVFNSSDIKQPYFTIKISNTKHHLKLNYSMRNEFLFVRCDQTIKNQPVVLINHICGGTGCDENNFGIIDPIMLKQFVSPSQDMKGNFNEANKIMGKKIKPFTCKNYTRTSNAKPQNGEYCYEAAVELG
jgi:hypothetical protein